MNNFIELASIKIPPRRQRKTFDPAELNDLRDSIEANGLLQAPVLRFDGTDYLLVAGERRLRAITDLYELGGRFRFNNRDVVAGMVPYVNLGDLPELEAREAEFEENIRRVNLSWQEEAEATMELMVLRKLRAEKDGTPSPTIATITEELHENVTPNTQATVKNQLMAARYLADADVAKAATLSDAVKVIKKKEKVARDAQLAAIVGATFESSAHKAFNQDAREWAADILSGSFDVILTDPPYGMGADEFGDSGGKAEGAHGYVDSYENWLDIMGWFPQETFRLAKPDAHAYVFCDPDRFLELRSLMASAGWKVFRTPLIWFKPSAYRAPWPDQGPQRKYEFILFAVKGSKKVNHLAGDVLVYQPDENLGHGAQKPVGLFEDLLRRSIRPGEQALDLFSGTGPLIPAAHSLLAAATCIEKDPVSYAKVVGRLQELQAQPDASPL